MNKICTSVIKLLYTLVINYDKVVYYYPYCDVKDKQISVK